MALVDLTTLEQEMKAMRQQLAEKLLFLLVLRYIPENEKMEAIIQIQQLLDGDNIKPFTVEEPLEI